MFKICPLHLVPARFQSHEQNVTVIADHQVVLTCQASGHLPLEIQWSKDGVLYTTLFTPDKFRIESVAEENIVKSTMTIFKATREDSALYTCHAINKHGEDEHFIQLFVQGKSL